MQGPVPGPQQSKTSTAQAETGGKRSQQEHRGKCSSLDRKPGGCESAVGWPPAPSQGDLQPPGGEGAAGSARPGALNPGVHSVLVAARRRWMDGLRTWKEWRHWPATLTLDASGAPRWTERGVFRVISRGNNTGLDSPSRSCHTILWELCLCNRFPVAGTVRITSDRSKTWPVCNEMTTDTLSNHWSLQNCTAIGLTDHPGQRPLSLSDVLIKQSRSPSGYLSKIILIFFLFAALPLIPFVFQSPSQLEYRLWWSLLPDRKAKGWQAPRLKFLARSTVGKLGFLW